MGCENQFVSEKTDDLPQTSESSAVKSINELDYEKNGSANGKTNEELSNCSYRECNTTYGRLTHSQEYPHADKKRKHFMELPKLKTVNNSLNLRNEEDLKIYKCSYDNCNAVFRQRWRLASHISTHTGEKLYVCSKEGCGRSYSSVGHMRRHVAKTHGPLAHITTEYLCSEEGCTKSYKSLESLRKHYNSRHTKDVNENPGDEVNFHKCTCGKAFKKAAHLAWHKRIHNKDPAFKCDVCSEMFSSSNTLNKHKRIHSRFKCDEPGCGKRFSQSSLLQEHIKTEHEKRFCCKICNKKFASTRYIKTHLETHLLYDERKRFPCTYNGCTRFYSTKSNLTQHVKSCHLSLKFQCSFVECGKEFVTKQKLQKHMKVHNGLQQPVHHKSKPRNQRKDAGIPQRSAAVKLSGLTLSYAEEKRLCAEIEKLTDDSLQDDLCSVSSENSLDLELSDSETDVTQ